MKIERIKSASFKSKSNINNSLAKTYISYINNSLVINRLILSKKNMTDECWKLIRHTKWGNLYVQSIAFKEESFIDIMYIFLNKEEYL